MATKKPGRKRFDPAAEQRRQLLLAVDSVTECSIECMICGETDAAQGTTEEDYASELFQEGWRYGTSEKFQAAGVMCPTCFKTPDADRGED